MKYSLCGVILRVFSIPASRAACVTRTLESLFSLMPSSGPGSEFRVEIFLRDLPEEEVSGEVVFDAPGLRALRTEQGYHLQSGGSYLGLDMRSGLAAGWLSEAFLNSPLEDQRGLFLFALLLLLSGQGLYGLHAGGVVWDGCGFLLVGDSGSGKTTLTCALARSGWQYLSDDSVLLTRGKEGLEALAFGRPFHCAQAMFRHFPELKSRAIGASEQSPVFGKQLVDVAPIYPGRFRSSTRPQVILFPEITRARCTRLVPLDSTAALLRILSEGAGLLHSRQSMTDQVTLLVDLVRNASAFRVMTGADVHHEPHKVSVLLRQLAKPGAARRSASSPISNLRGDHTDELCSAA